MSRDFLCIELAFDDDLRGDTCMVGSGNPCRIETAHAVVTYQTVHDGLVEGVSHVQGARDIGRRELNGERRFVFVERSAEISAFFPFLTPVFLNFGWVERLG